MSLRYYGELAQSRTGVIVNGVLAGLFKPVLSTGVTVVNARSVAAEHGIDIVESRSTRARNYTSLISLKIRTATGERWVEGAVFEQGSPRLVLVDGIAVEAPLEGTMIVVSNRDEPGVIGEIGTILGTARRQHRQLRAWARNNGHAIGVVIVDETAPIPEIVIEDLCSGSKVQCCRTGATITCGARSAARLDRSTLHGDVVRRRHPQRAGVVLRFVVEGEENRGVLIAQRPQHAGQPVVAGARRDVLPGPFGLDGDVRQTAASQVVAAARDQLCRLVLVRGEVRAVEWEDGPELLLPSRQRLVVGDRCAVVERPRGWLSGECRRSRGGVRWYGRRGGNG